MHEYSVGYEIVKTVIKNANDYRATSVVKIRIEIGELTLINVEQIKFWLTELFKGTVAEKAKLLIRVIKPKIICENCGYKMTSTTYVCLKCGAGRLKIVKGKECTVKNMEIC